MKTIVDFDYKWALTGCMRYARRQAMMLSAIKDGTLDVDGAIGIMTQFTSPRASEKAIMEKYGVKQVAAREFVELPISRFSRLDAEKELSYYEDAAKKLDELLKSYE